MAQIPRPPKQGNVTTYVAKVAAGYFRILASEMDADLDTIYAAWNGGADTVNLRDGSVTSAKLAADAVGPRELAEPSVGAQHIFDGQVITSKLPDGAVTDPKIVSVSWSKVTDAPTALPPTGPAGGDLAGAYPSPAIRAGAVTAAKLAAGAVTGTSLADNSIGAQHIVDGQVITSKLPDGAVTLAKLSVGASVAAIAGQQRTTTVACTALNNEQLYLEYTWTSRGGIYLVLAGLHVVFGIDSSGGSFALNLRLDGTPGVATDGSVVAFQWYQEATNPNQIIGVPTSLCVGYTSSGLAAGTHRIKITGIPINRFVSYAHINSGWSTLVELA